MLRRYWLIKKRNILNLTQESVAEKAGISRAYYTEIEIGTKNPSVKSAQKIAKVLGFNWSFFFENNVANCEIK